jgi:hypothetical protein
MTPAQRSRGPDDLGWRGLLLSVAFLVGMWILLWGLTLVGDSTRVSTELAASRRENSVMMCMDGIIDYEETGLLSGLAERLFGEGYFRCTEWRMRETPKSTW